jgi:hypothetical protein
VAEELDSVKQRIAYSLWYRTKTRAKARNLEFTLTRKFVDNAIIQGICPILGVAFNVDPDRKSYSAFAASIDRIDPNQGYTKRNCQIVCWIYNRAKGNGTHNEVLILAEALMPSKSKAQHNFMEMIAHSPKTAKKAGVPQSVGKDFAAADKGKKFKQGGEMADKKFDLKKLFKGKESVGEELKEAKAIKSGKITPMQYAKGEKSEPVKKMKAGGKCYRAGGFVKAADGCATKGKTKGRFV